MNPRSELVPISEHECAEILRRMPNDQPVGLSFGPAGAWLKANDENRPALDILAEMRGAPPSRQL